MPLLKISEFAVSAESLTNGPPCPFATFDQQRCENAGTTTIEHLYILHSCTSLYPRHTVHPAHKKRSRFLKGREGDRDRITRLGSPGIRTTWGEMVRHHTTHICETTRYYESSIIWQIAQIRPLMGLIPVITHSNIYHQRYLQLCRPLHAGANLLASRI